MPVLRSERRALIERSSPYRRPRAAGAPSTPPVARTSVTAPSTCAGTGAGTGSSLFQIASRIDQLINLVPPLLPRLVDHLVWLVVIAPTAQRRTAPRRPSSPQQSTADGREVTVRLRLLHGLIVILCNII